MRLKSTIAAFLLIGFILAQIGCSPAFYEGFAQGFANSSSTSKKLMLFGGENNKEYLGCVNCSEFSTESILNEYGLYGSKYSATSIWNKYGTYGSKYSQYSPWNTYASNPPIIVDEDGGFYGYFTVNKYYPRRITIQSILKLLNTDIE